MESSKKNDALILLICDTPWLWSVDYVNQIAFEFSKNNLVICYLSADINSWNKLHNFKFLFKKVNKNLYLYNPFNFFPLINYRLNKVNLLLNLFLVKCITLFITWYKKINNKVFWIFDPALINIYNHFSEFFLLYDCVDFFIASDYKNKLYNIEAEKYLCKKAGLVVANSKVLQKHLKKYRQDVKLSPQGFREDMAPINHNKYINLHLKHPVIGFVGGINNRLDTKLLEKLIKNNPKWNFVFWGPIQSDLPTGSDRLNAIMSFLKLPNVITGKSIDKEEISGIISQFDIGIIPYDISQDFNKYCYPMKLFEYFYLGKPVVSTDILELRRFPNFVKIGKNYKEWEKAIADILSSTWSKEKIKEELALAKKNSWEKTIEAIKSYL
jgi:hypothetical protein